MQLGGQTNGWNSENLEEHKLAIKPKIMIL